MRLVRFGTEGDERPGVWVADSTIVDVSRHVRDFSGDFFADGGVERLRGWLRRKSEGAKTVSPSRVRLGAPVARPGKVVCIGLNYSDHAAESGMPPPEEPIVFYKASNTVVGPNDSVLLPVGGEKTDWEVELAVLVGNEARYLPDLSAARQVVAGYAVSNDVSERGFQLERGGQWVKGKSCETFNPLGPWLLTADEVPDPQRLRLELSVNGEVMQSGTTANMLFSVDHLVWYLSQFMVLEPGDLINTGTPAGVGLGRKPPRYLAEGDVMDVAIEGLGRQRQSCRRASVERLHDGPAVSAGKPSQSRSALMEANDD